MSLNHIQRKIVNDPSLVDITGAQMVLVMKLTAFCWNVHDGRLPERDLSDFQKEHAIREMPTLFEYAAYVLFFPSLMAGPSFDYIEYRRWIETSMFQVPPGTDPAKAPRTHKKRRIPRSGTPAALKAVAGLGWLLAFMKLGASFDPNYLLSSTFSKHGLLRRIWIMYMTNFTARTKYYAVWSLTEGACILSGIGYRGLNATTGRPDWDRLQNVSPMGIELAQNSRAYLGNWNINTNNWLRSYMYLRVTPKGKKPGFRASMATFMTSAVWHGFEAGYYMTFILASFIQTIAKSCRRYIRPLFLIPGEKDVPTKSKIYFDVASWLVTQLAFSFTTTPFLLLTLPASLAAWMRVYFYCVFGVVGFMAFFASPGKAWLESLQGKRLRSAGIAIEGPTAKAKGSAGDKRAKGTTSSSLAPSPIPEEGARKVVNRKPAPRGVVDGEHADSGPQLGLPENPGEELEEIMDELKREVEVRKARGMSVGEGLRNVAGEVGKGLDTKGGD